MQCEVCGSEDVQQCLVCEGKGTVANSAGAGEVECPSCRGGKVLNPDGTAHVGSGSCRG